MPGSAEAPNGDQEGTSSKQIVHGQFYSELGDDEVLELEDGNGGKYDGAGEGGGTRDERARVPTQWYQEMEGDAGKVYELGDGGGGRKAGGRSVRNSKADQILGR